MLHRFFATTDALTCARLGAYGQLEALTPGLVPAGFPASCTQPSDHSIPTHVPCPTRLFYRSPFSTGIYLWLRVTQSLLGLRSSLAGSPSMDRRIGFVILRTGRSPSVAPHAGISPTQSLWLPGGELLPEADLHRSGCATRRRTRARRSLARRLCNHPLFRCRIPKTRI